MRQKQGNRIDTTEVQGEGSFVIAKPLTWDELKELQALTAEQTEEEEGHEEVAQEEGQGPEDLNSRRG